jgi:hypothetical protein
VIPEDPGLVEDWPGKGLTGGTDVGEALGAWAFGVRVEGAGITVAWLGAADVGRVPGWPTDDDAPPPHAANPTAAATATARGATSAILMA